MDSKDKIREEMKKQRRLFTEKEASSKIICEKILSMDKYLSSSCVCLYLSSFGEVDTSLILEDAKKRGKTILVPISEKNGDLNISLYSENLKEGLFGIKEPENITLVPHSLPDFVIVPALAFDRSGNRLGFGKGYYDRFLKNNFGFKVGLCYSFQLVSSLPSYDHDIKVDSVVTENDTLFF